MRANELMRPCVVCFWAAKKEKKKREKKERKKQRKRHAIKRPTKSE